MTIATRFAKSLWSHNPIPTGCVFYLPLWNSPLIRGSSFSSIDPRRHNCVRNGGVIADDGWTADGDDKIDILPVYTNALSATTTGTFIVWIKPTDANDIGRIIAFGDTDSNEWLDLSNGSANRVSANLWDALTNEWGVDEDTGSLQNGVWSMVTVVQNGTEPVIYRDNTTPTQTFFSSNDKTRWFNDIGGVDNGFIGVRSKNSTVDGYFNGTIGEVTIYDRDLSAAEITYYYSRTRGRY